MTRKKSQACGYARLCANLISLDLKKPKGLWAALCFKHCRACLPIGQKRHANANARDSCHLKVFLVSLTFTLLCFLQTKNLLGWQKSENSGPVVLQLLEIVFVRRITRWANHVLCILHSRSFKVTSTNSGVHLPLIGGTWIALWVEHMLALVAKLRVPFWLPRVPSRNDWWTMTLRAKHMLWALAARLWVPFFGRSCLVTAWLPTMKVIVSC